MPRKKRSSVAGASKSSKRWCQENTESTSTVQVVPDPSSQPQRQINERLSGLNFHSPEYILETSSTKYILVEVGNLSQLFAGLKCKSCDSFVRLVVGSRKGFLHDLKVVCNACHNMQHEPSSSAMNQHPKHADVNFRIVQSFLSFGKGFAALEKFCTIMSMDGMSSRTFNEYKKLILSSSVKSTDEILEEARLKIKEVYGKTAEDIVDISVSFDGTWLTRGHSSNIGVACVIDILSGFVVDFTVLSKRCTMCEQTKAALGENSPEFSIWYEGHQEDCSINHTGSSGAMEISAAMKLWRRSTEIGFRYTTMLSDGDSKAFIALNEAKIYGSDVVLKKEECVNHVSKRLGTALRKCVQVWKNKGVTLGGKKHGSLKETTIKRLTKYYTSAIHKHKGDVKGMKTAIYATLFHAISTDEKPQHTKCPTGVNSWCFYQSALANGVEPGSHKDNVGTPVSEEHLPKIMPIYQRLASDELLERCTRCATQNANESIHSIIWSKCSKESCASIERVTIAVCDAISEFNFGTRVALEKFQEHSGISFSRDSATRKDVRRTYLRNRKNTELFRVAQKKVRLAIKQKAKSIKKKEGVMYKSGNFYNLKK